MSEASDMFVVNLHLPAEGGTVVRSCELRNGDLRNRVSFPKLPDLFAVFTARLSAEIDALVDALGPKKRSFSNPDFAIDLPGLKIAGLRILVSATRDGARLVSLRFRYFIGSFQSAFATDLGLSETRPTHTDRIAVESLVDIVGPLYSLALMEDRRPLTAAEKAEVETVLGELQEKALSLRFYSDLLIRYVRDSGEGAESAEKRSDLSANPKVTPLRLID